MLSLAPIPTPTPTPRAAALLFWCRGGIICTTDHFKPLWGKNVPHFGLAHALALGLAPWLAVEIPDLINTGRLVYKDTAGTPSAASADAAASQ